METHENASADVTPEQWETPAETPHQAPGAAAFKHSGPGIASFIVFLTMAAALAACMIMFAVLASGSIYPDGTFTPGWIEQMPMLAVGLLLMLGSAFGTVIGLVLGIVGLVQKERKKLFAILGTVFNGLVAALLAFLFALAIIIGSGTTA